MRGSRIVGRAVVASLMAAAPLGAQEVEVGVRGGVSSTTVAWKASPVGSRFADLDRRTAVTGGAYMAVGLGAHLRGRIEALFAQKGFTEVDDDATSSIAVDYLEIPLLLGVTPTGRNERVVPELFAGPWIAFEARCRADATTPELSVSFDCDDVPEEPVLRRTTDWGVILGAGVLIPQVGPFRASLDARWSAGLRNIDAEAELDNLHTRHRGFLATLGLGLPVGG